MSREANSVRGGAAIPDGSEGAKGTALGYRAAGDPERGVWVRAGGSHGVRGLTEEEKTKLLSAVLDFKAEKGARLVLLGAEVAGLKIVERAALRRRVAFLPASGGLLSSLNAWENIVLPIGFHDPKHLKGMAVWVYGLVAELRSDPRTLLGKLPEGMSLYEKKLTGYVRILLERPDLIVADDLDGGLNATERTATEGFAAVYHAHCPAGTFVRLEHPRDT
jgi:predicted ABC-type transport system involved in lysophospholipase L1 biosynthesis ATPase subunit